MKKKKPTIDAQRVKRAMHAAADKIGKRKRVRAGALFEMLVEVVNQELY